MKLNRNDIQAVTTEAHRRPRGLWPLGPEALMDFREPLLGRDRICIGIREGRFTSRSNHQSHRMCEAITNWWEQTT